MSTDAIVLLKNDHKEIRRLFKQFQSAGDVEHVADLLCAELYAVTKAVDAVTA